jgi:hypothetical protein
MSRIASVVGWSLVVAAATTIAAPAFAQDEPSVEPAPAEAAPIEPPPAGAEPAEPAPAEAVPAEPAPLPPSRPVVQESAARPAVFDNRGFEFGLRFGYALPYGNVRSSIKLTDAATRALPVVFEAGYRLNGNFTLGALLQFGVVEVSDSLFTGCEADVSCSGSVVRFGIEGIYNLDLDAALSPWIGIGAGYEWLNLTGSMNGHPATVDNHGFELVTVHAGADYRVSPQFALGPFVSFSLAEYATSYWAYYDLSQTTHIPDKSLHEWLQLGIRGRFGF